jgi:putative FmdB family regulatory protein
MPIYAYRCAACGHAQDVLQKLSDPLLTVCPACGAAAYTKQVTAAGFQLKGSGWYVTDFRGGNTAAKKGEGEGAEAKPQDASGEAAADKAPAGDKPADKAGEPKSDAKPAEKAAAPAAPATPPPPPASGS